MALSRQLKALGKIGAAFGVAWGLVGTTVGALAGGGLVPSLLSYGIMFGTAGAISGLATGLLVARGEAGKAVEEISSWRASLWGFLGGFIPAALFTGIVLMEGAADMAVPLLILGTISGGVGGTVCGIAAASAKRLDAPTTMDERRQIDSQ